MSFIVKINAEFNAPFDPAASIWSLSIINNQAITEAEVIVGSATIGQRLTNLTFNELLNTLESELVKNSERLEKIPTDLSRTISELGK
jgi:hypothetical protein